MNNFFTYNNVSGMVELNEPEILLIKEFSELMDPNRNKTTKDPEGKHKSRAFREFTYIYLAINWRSPYADYSEQERHKEALKDASITEEEFNDPSFRAACRKYRDMQNSNRSIKMLKAAQKTVDDFIDYFETIVDLNERDDKGKPIFVVKNIISEISSLHKVHEELLTLEGQVKKEIAETSKVRAGATEGFKPKF